MAGYRTSAAEAKSQCAQGLARHDELLEGYNGYGVKIEDATVMSMETDTVARPGRVLRHKMVASLV
jgi:hypothetical protein